MYGMIATWRMALEGVQKGNEILKNHGNCQDALEEAVKDVEDFEYYKSVGFSTKGVLLTTVISIVTLSLFAALVEL